MTNTDQKAAIRERMASTGENYTTAKRAIELARLKAQSEQLDSTLAEQRTRTLNERFDTVAEQLGSDKSPAVRLAAVYAMAGLADDWQDHRQTCVDVLCAYLRMPYEPGPGDDAPWRSGWLSRPAARSATPSSGSSPHISTAPRPSPGVA